MSDASPVFSSSLQAYASQPWSFVGRGGRERLAAAEVLAAHLGKNGGFESVLPLSVHTRCLCHC